MKSVRSSLLWQDIRSQRWLERNIKYTYSGAHIQEGKETKKKKSLHVHTKRKRDGDENVQRQRKLFLKQKGNTHHGCSGSVGGCLQHPLDLLQPHLPTVHVFQPIPNTPDLTLESHMILFRPYLSNLPARPSIFRRSVESQEKPMVFHQGRSMADRSMRLVSQRWR